MGAGARDPPVAVELEDRQLEGPRRGVGPGGPVGARAVGRAATYEVQKGSVLVATGRSAASSQTATSSLGAGPGRQPKGWRNTPPWETTAVRPPTLNSEER